MNQCFFNSIKENSARKASRKIFLKLHNITSFAFGIYIKNNFIFFLLQFAISLRKFSFLSNMRNKVLLLTDIVYLKNITINIAGMTKNGVSDSWHVAFRYTKLNAKRRCIIEWDFFQIKFVVYIFRSPINRFSVCHIVDSTRESKNKLFNSINSIVSFI